MADSPWQARFALGVPEIDQEHQQLFSLAAELTVALSTQRGADELERVFDELYDYVRTHFEHEEALMERVGYPELIQHRALHAELTRQLTALRSESDNSVATAVQLNRLLGRWLRGHILETDMKLASFLEQ